MDEQILKVNVNSIIKAKTEFKKHCDNILDSLTRMENEIAKIDDIYNTKTAIAYQEKLTTFLTGSIGEVSDDKSYFDNLFNEITNEYTELNNEIQTSIAIKHDNEV